MTWTASVLFFLCSLVNLLGQAWPKKVSPPAGVDEFSVVAGAGSFIYQTKSFEIVTFKKHDHTLMTDFTRCLESVPVALKAIPVPLYAVPEDKRGQLLLTANEDDYLRAGGAKNTAGFYDGAKNRIIINWVHFKNNTAQTRVLQDPAFDLIVHELTHLSMHELMWKCDPWLAEGIAEYMAASHLNRGNFSFEKIDQAIRTRVVKHTKPGVNGSTVLGIKNLISLSSRGWLERTANVDAWEALKAYNSALLLAHYCFHGGATRLETTRKHFELLHDNKTMRDSIPRLLSVNDAQEIEKALSGYWKKRGLKLIFDHKE
ncbi:hypothetical protein N9195_01665 [bacterium]|nr:hypothetical protein [bacterium]